MVDAVGGFRARPVARGRKGGGEGGAGRTWWVRSSLVAGRRIRGFVVTAKPGKGSPDRREEQVNQWKGVGGLGEGNRYDMRGERAYWSCFFNLSVITDIFNITAVFWLDRKIGCPNF
jgi:hypothetical protein